MQREAAKSLISKRRNIGANHLEADYAKTVCLVCLVGSRVSCVCEAAAVGDGRHSTWTDVSILTFFSNLHSLVEMSDIRALLAEERKARQIAHPHLAYSKAGHLQCTVCDLNIPTEKLWEPHLRSANHKKNAYARDDNVSVNKKRKIDDDVDDGEQDARVHGDLVRGAKKSKSVKFNATPEVFVERIEEYQENEDPEGIPEEDDDDEESPVDSTEQILEAATSTPILTPKPPEPDPTPDFVDEDEWAAFERDLAPLAREIPSVQTDKFANATITAPAVSAADLAKQREASSSDRRGKRRDYEAEAQDEREEEEARMLEEFAVMEEMEQRVKRLRHMREALRGNGPQALIIPDSEDVLVNTTHLTAPEAELIEELGGDAKRGQQINSEDADEDEEGDDIDDWFS